MKKIISLTLALMLVFSLATVASAQAEYGDESQVTITKVYKLIGDGSSPAEAFTLQQVGDGTVVTGEADTAPALGTITGATFEAGAANATGVTADITIDLPTYTNVGVYEYKLQEVAGTNAGVAYYGEEILLRVTVINGEDGNVRIAAVHTEIPEADITGKKDYFENTYSAGTLSVSKTVTGNAGDQQKYFEFTVTLTGETGKTYPDSFAVTGGSNTANPTTIVLGAATTFLLKHGDTISIENLPYGVTYSVSETAPEDYTVTSSGENGTINDAAQTAAFTNSKTVGVDTGITLDSIPFILILAVCAGAVVLFVVKRRRSVDF